jgi:hypothetical protein
MRTDSPERLVRKELAAVFGLEERAKSVRHLEPALVINSGWGVASKQETPRQLLHFWPQISTEIVGDAQMDVNRKIWPVSKLRQIFAV